MSLEPEIREVRCPVCGTAVIDNIRYCESCETPHHVECWEYVGKCAMFGCTKNCPVTSVQVKEWKSLEERIQRLINWHRYYMYCFVGLWLSLFMTFIPRVLDKLLLNNAIELMIGDYTYVGAWVMFVFVVGCGISWIVKLMLGWIVDVGAKTKALDSKHANGFLKRFDEPADDILGRALCLVKPGCEWILYRFGPIAMILYMILLSGFYVFGTTNKLLMSLVLTSMALLFCSIPWAIASDERIKLESMQRRFAATFKDDVLP